MRRAATLSASSTHTHEAHRKSTETSLQDIAKYLSEALGTSMVAYMSDVDKKTVGRWIAGGSHPQRPSEERLRAAYMVFQYLLAHDSDHTARAWFIGLNPQLDDIAPASAIRDGRLREVWTAAKSFTLGG
jgi:hypothetical protein